MRALNKASTDILKAFVEELNTVLPDRLSKEVSGTMSEALVVDNAVLVHCQAFKPLATCRNQEMQTIAILCRSFAS